LTNDVRASERGRGALPVGEARVARAGEGADGGIGAAGRLGAEVAAAAVGLGGAGAGVVGAAIAVGVGEGRAERQRHRRPPRARERHLRPAVARRRERSLGDDDQRPPDGEPAHHHRPRQARCQEGLRRERARAAVPDRHRERHRIAAAQRADLDGERRLLGAAGERGGRGGGDDDR